jgi:inorganic pyrophosphatase
MTYPFDYGYLAGTVAADGGGIDVWLGMQASANERRVTGVICAVDLLKRDSEIKILLGGGGADYRGIYEPRRFTLPTGQAHLLKAEKTQDRQYRKQSIL